MAYSKLISKKTKMINLKLVVEKLQRSFSLGKRLSMSDVDELQDQHEEEVCHYGNYSNKVPEDVKEGHFVAVAVDEGEAKRFVLPLRYLTHPMFLALLEKAAEEYGFDHGGALTIPCRPIEIEKLVAERWDGGRPNGSRRRDNNYRRNFNIMVQSY